MTNQACIKIRRANRLRDIHNEVAYRRSPWALLDSRTLGDVNSLQGLASLRERSMRNKVRNFEVPPVDEAVAAARRIVAMPPGHVVEAIRKMTLDRNLSR